MKIEDYRDAIAALVPFYDEAGGNATRIFTTTGEVIEDRRTLRWIIRKLARIYAIDLEALRQNYGKHLYLSQGVPLPFSKRLVFVPLKFRRVIGENDGAGGYVNICAVEKVEDYSDGDASYKSRIYLSGNQVIPCLFTRKTVERRLRSGDHAYERYISNNKSGYYTSGLVKESTCEDVIPPELLIAMGKLFLKSLS